MKLNYYSLNFFFSVFIHLSAGLKSGGTSTSTGKTISFLRVANDVVSKTSRKDSGVFAPKENSYWIPYSDRTTAVITFPVIPAELFQRQVEVSESEPDLPWNKYLPPPPKQKTKVTVIAKPKSDLGVVVSRNYILKENFRDYANLSKFPKNMKSPDELLLETSQQFLDSYYHSPFDNFAIIAFESRLRNSKASNNSNGPVLHNGTLTVRSSRNTRQIVSIPFTVKTPQKLDKLLKRINKVKEIDTRVKDETTAFLKTILGIHTETFLEGKKAQKRFHKRSKNLKRPEFVISVENSSETKFDDPIEEKEAVRERIRLGNLEEESRSDSWLHTTTVAMRVISSPSFDLKKVSIPNKSSRPHRSTRLPQVFKLQLEDLASFGTTHLDTWAKYLNFK